MLTGTDFFDESTVPELELEPPAAAKILNRYVYRVNYRLVETSPVPSPPRNEADRPAWQMTRAEYQKYRKSKGFTDITENNRAYWREVEAAIDSGKPVSPEILAEYKQLKGTR